MLTSLSLQGFRSYPETSFTFPPGITALVGPNGRGKTNVLEAVHLLSTGKSWRVSSVAPLITHHQDSSRIDARIDDDTYTVFLSSRRASLHKNEKSTPWRAHLGRIPTVLFAPEMDHLWRGTKTERWRVFNRFISSLWPEYVTLLSRTNRVLAQKRALLQQDVVPTDIFDSYNHLLATLVPQITHFRTQAFAQLQPHLSAALQAISGHTEPLHLHLWAPPEMPPDLDPLQQLAALKPREILSRRLLYSPTRQDVRVLYRDAPLLETASRGEERSVLVALIAAQRALLHAHTGRLPILLLDDVFSELDSTRQAHLRALCAEGQVFLTTTHTAHLEGFPQDVHLIDLHT